MTDNENDDTEEKKKKKGEGEEGGVTRKEASASQGFFDYMIKIGASKSLIAEILRSWRHFKGEGLLRRVVDFARSLVKSSHVEVEIDRGKDYGVVHNFIQETKDKAHAPEVRQTIAPNPTKTPKP